MRLIAGFDYNKKGMIFTLYFLVYFVFLARGLQQEITTGETIIPRYTAYQIYFMSLFSIFTVTLSKKIGNNPSNLVTTIMSVFIFLGMLFCRYLGNMLYVFLGRPSEILVQ
jgi:hypothetical protein